MSIPLTDFIVASSRPRKVKKIRKSDQEKALERQKGEETIRRKAERLVEQQKDHEKQEQAAKEAVIEEKAALEDEIRANLFSFAIAIDGEGSPARQEYERRLKEEFRHMAEYRGYDVLHKRRILTQYFQLRNEIRSVGLLPPIELPVFVALTLCRDLAPMYGTPITHSIISQYALLVSRCLNNCQDLIEVLRARGQPQLADRLLALTRADSHRKMSKAMNRDDDD